MNILTRRIREKNFMSNTMKENKMGTMPVNKLLINHGAANDDINACTGTV